MPLLRELAHDETSVSHWNVGEARVSQRDYFGWARRDVDVLTIVPTEYGQHLTLETPTTPVGVGGNPVPEANGEPDGPCDDSVLGESRVCHTKKIPYW